MKLKEIASKGVMPLHKDTQIKEALKYMQEHSISSVVIVNKEQKPLGIFTEHDVVNTFTKNIDKNCALEMVMSKNIFTLSEDLELHTGYMCMQEQGFHHLVIINNNGEYQGVVSEGDFLRHMGYKELNLDEAIAPYVLPAYLIVEPTQKLNDVVEQMHKVSSDYAIVIDSGRPIGKITQRDITSYYAKDLQAKKPLVVQLDFSQIETVAQTISLHDAVNKMEKHGVHQLIVVDDKDELVGVLLRQNILRAMYGEYFEFLLQTLEEKTKKAQLLEAMHHELQQTTSFLRAVVDTLPDLVWLKDLEGRYLACNPMFERYFGSKEDAIIGKTDFDFIDAELANSFVEHDRQALRNGKALTNEEYLTFADGTIEGLFDTVKTPMYSSDGEVIGILGIAHNVTKRKEREEVLEKLANYDLLTNLPNRSLFKTHLKKSLSNALRSGGSIAVVMFDLDKFKDVNDSYGHTIGDELLKQVAKRFLERTRQGDIVGRLGGDEFAVILENIKDPSDAMSFTNEVLGSLEKVYILSDELQVHISSSAGIVIAPKDAQSVEALMQYADSALYKAKNEVLSSCRYYTDEMTQVAKAKIAYENELRYAIEREELEIFYQPQVHLQTGKIVGAEALLRWNHPKEGRISPAVFIPIAEESGLITSIGEWVLQQACIQAKKWLDMGHRFTMAVNVSATQVKFQDIPAMVDKALRLSGYDANKLELEITESALMQREEEIVKMLHELRAKGIRLAIDDFGTGYSSLAYLKRFPIDVLKIDKSFIDDIPYEKDDMAIVIAIIEMGKALGYDVLAEGVEESEQMEFLFNKGCTMYQGYYKSEPLEAKRFLELLEQQ